MKSRHSVLACLLVLWMISPTACSRREESSHLRLSLQTEPTTLDPVYAVDYSSGMMTSLIHSNLVRFDPDGCLVPDLAGSWEVNGDGTRYTFHLAPARFSNSRRIVSGDVLYSFKRCLGPGAVSPRWWVLAGLKGATQYHGGEGWDDGAILTPDDSTVVLVLENPTSHFLGLLSMPAAAVVCREEVERLGVDYSRSPCGGGPWMLAGWRDGGEIVLRRNPYDRKEHSSIEGISFRIIPETMTRIAEFEVGNLDVLEVPREELELWRSAGQELQHRQELRVVYIGLNNAKPPFDDLRVRRALNMGVDIEAIIVHVLFGAGRKAHGCIPDALRKGPPPKDQYVYNPKKAKDLLEQAGCADGLELEIWQRENPEGGRILESVQGYLSMIGVEVTIVVREWGAFKQAVDQGTPDAFYLDWFADYPDAENFIAPLFHSSNIGGAGNRARYRNGSVDSLIESAAACSDESRRWALYASAEEQVYSDAPWIFLWFPTRYEVVSYRLEGYTIPAIFNGQRYLGVTFRE